MQKWLGTNAVTHCVNLKMVKVDIHVSGFLVDLRNPHRELAMLHEAGPSLEALYHHPREPVTFKGLCGINKAHKKVISTFTFS